MKIFNHIILNRISESLNNLITNTQAGFRRGKSCIDQINTVRILTEQSAEFNANLYLTFIDFEKAFDAIERNYIWKALEVKGIPPKIINIIRQSYDGSAARVVHAGQLSDPFFTVSGVKQGCALSPLLFITTLDLILREVNNARKGIDFGLNGKLGELAYADDIVLLSHRQQDMQSQLAILEKESAKIGLNININKTKSMRVNASNNIPLSIRNTQIDEVNKFEYLGCILDDRGGTLADVQNRLRKAKYTFARLSKVWRCKKLHLSTKLRIFNACVKSVMLYGSETWFVTNVITQKMQSFINRCLRSILGIWWPRKITNERLWQITIQAEISTEIRRKKYSWLGHTLRKDSEDVTLAALEWNPQGRRNRGRPKATWRRTIYKETSKSFRELRYIARNRQQWKQYITNLCN